MVTSRAVVGSSQISTWGFAGRRDGDDHALAHTARELVRVLLVPALGVGDAYLAQHLDGGLLGGFALQAW